MAGLDTSGFLVDDDLLNFTLDDEDVEKLEKTTTTTMEKDFCYSSSLESSNPSSHLVDDHSFPEFEEELEWISNKDAFPALETCFELLSDNPSIELDHHSPVSVLENSSISSNSKNNSSGDEKGSGSTITSCCGSLQVPIKYPVGKRSKRRRRHRRVALPELLSDQSLWLDQVNVKAKKQVSALALPPVASKTSDSASIGRKCLHCHADKTPQWRAGPMGPKTLCNACGVRYKSGRLVPEYRPANSPTFSASVHSNSHRKIIEMRRQKEMGGIEVNQACGYNRVVG